MSSERLLKTIEAARYLDVPRETLNLYVKQGKIKAFRLPGGHLRFEREELDRFCSSRETIANYKCIRDRRIDIIDYAKEQIGQVSARGASLT